MFVLQDEEEVYDLTNNHTKENLHLTLKTQWIASCVLKLVLVWSFVYALWNGAGVSRLQYSTKYKTLAPRETKSVDVQRCVVA